MIQPVITMTFEEFEELQKAVEDRVPETLERILQEHAQPAFVQEFLKDFQRFLTFLKLEEVKRLYGDSTKNPRTYVHAIDRVSGEINRLLR